MTPDLCPNCHAPITAANATWPWCPCVWVEGDDGARIIVKMVKEWVVEVEPAKNPILTTWDVGDVKAACDLTPDGQATTWRVLNPSEMTSSEINALTVWRQYKDQPHAI